MTNQRSNVPDTEDHNDIKLCNIVFSSLVVVVGFAVLTSNFLDYIFEMRSINQPAVIAVGVIFVLTGILDVHLTRKYGSGDWRYEQLIKEQAALLGFIGSLVLAGVVWSSIF